MKDPISRRSRGFGFITYENASDVDIALAQETHTIDARQVSKESPLSHLSTPLDRRLKQSVLSREARPTVILLRSQQRSPQPYQINQIISLLHPQIIQSFNLPLLDMITSAVIQKSLLVDCIMTHAMVSSPLTSLSFHLSLTLCLSSQ
jgi:hypothetical protein